MNAEPLSGEMSVEYSKGELTFIRKRTASKPTRFVTTITNIPLNRAELNNLIAILQRIDSAEPLPLTEPPPLVETVMATIFESDPIKKIQALREDHERNVQRFTAMPNLLLAAHADYYHKQSSRPNFEKGTAVYDVVMHDIIVPELIKRLGLEQERMAAEFEERAIEK